MIPSELIKFEQSGQQNVYANGKDHRGDFIEISTWWSDPCS